MYTAAVEISSLSIFTGGGVKGREETSVGLDMNREGRVE